MWFKAKCVIYVAIKQNLFVQTFFWGGADPHVWLNNSSLGIVWNLFATSFLKVFLMRQVVQQLQT